jgi:hypothetical protein
MAYQSNRIKRIKRERRIESIIFNSLLVLLGTPLFILMVLIFL